MCSPYQSTPLSACYDGESLPDEAPVIDAPPEGTPDAPPVEPVVELFTPEQLAVKLTERDAEWESRFATREAEINEIKAKYDTDTLERSLTDAAVAADAYSVEVLTAFLRPHAKVVDGQTVIEIENFRLTPTEAAGWMRSQPNRFGALFKSNVIGGLGSHSTAGGARGRPMDIRTVSQDAAAYRELRAKNPSALGFGGGR